MRDLEWVLNTATGPRRSEECCRNGFCGCLCRHRKKVRRVPPDRNDRLRRLHSSRALLYPLLSLKSASHFRSTANWSSSTLVNTTPIPTFGKTNTTLPRALNEALA